MSDRHHRFRTSEEEEEEIRPRGRSSAAREPATRDDARDDRDDDRDDDREEEVRVPLGSRREGRPRASRPEHEWRDDAEDVGAEERGWREAMRSRLVLLVGAGGLAAAALVGGLVFFGGGDEAPPPLTTAPPGPPSPAGPVAPAPGAAERAGRPPEALADGFARQIATAPQGRAGPAASPAEPPRPPRAPTGAPAAPLGLAPAFQAQGTAPAPPPPLATRPGGAESLGDADARPEPPPPPAPPPGLVEELRRLAAKVDRLGEDLAQTRARMDEALARIERQRRGSQDAILGGIADLRGELERRDAEIEELRRRTAELAATGVRQAAAPPPSPPPPRVVQASMRYTASPTHARLVLGFPDEPVYDIEQEGNEIRMRILGDVRPNLAGLPIRMRHIEYMTAAPGLLEIMVAEGTRVRHRRLGAQVVLSFHDGRTPPPPDSGEEPRARRRTGAAREAAADARPGGAEPPRAAAPLPGPERQDRPGGGPSRAIAPAEPPRQPEGSGTIEGLRLRSVSRRAVLVERGDGEIVRVELGEAIPGTRGAIAREIRKEGEVWVLETSAGVLRP